MGLRPAVRRPVGSPGRAGSGCVRARSCGAGC
jgi:hypothetical protein